MGRTRQGEDSRTFGKHVAQFIITLSVMVLFGSTHISTTLAAQANQIRIGGDYNYLKVPRGSGYRWCEDSCNSDARCKSWTFIKPGRQCRLKRVIAPARPGKCCVSGVKTAPLRKTRREICADFASNAVDQYDENLFRKCGYRGELWNDRYKKHFRSCLGLGPRQRAAQISKRRRQLRRCERNRKRINAECQRFAETAEQIGKAAGEHNCQLPNTSWLGGGYEGAYDWCRKNKDDANGGTLRAARTALSSCLRRGGGPFLERCDSYAKNAVAQYDKARRAECGLGGKRWHQSYRIHYQWCLKVDPWDIRNEGEVRAHALKRCLTQAGTGTEGKIACDHYARLASEQTRSNRKQNCGLKGRRWQANYDRHYAWCSTTSKLNRDGELKYRENELSKCFERGGGAYNEACDRYAVRAVRQFEKSEQGRCNFDGKYWNKSYIRHYKWCTKVSPGRRTRKNLERKALLATCKFGIRLPFGRQR